MSKSNLRLYQRLKIVKSLWGSLCVQYCHAVMSYRAWQYRSIGAFGKKNPQSMVLGVDCIAVSFALCILTTRSFRFRSFLKDCFLTEFSARQYSHSSISYSKLGLTSLWPTVALSHPGPCSHGDTARGFYFYGKLKKPMDTSHFRCPLNISRRSWMDNFFPQITLMQRKELQRRALRMEEPDELCMKHSIGSACFMRWRER